MANEPRALKAARYYRSRGYAVVPIPSREKGPQIPGWQNLQLTEDDLPRLFANGQNIGLLNGEPSGGLTDIDLDAREALVAADFFLPATDMVHGRASKPRSHRWYRVDRAVETEQWRAPDGDTLVELRSSGTQTVAPPSRHPSGEPIEWVEMGEPAEVDGRVLRHAVAQTAAAALMARAWPAEGSRHDAALALAGTLVRHTYWDDDGIQQFLLAICAAAGDGETRDRIKTVGYTRERLKRGGRATGIPKLTLRLGRVAVERALEWLGIEMTGRPDGEGAATGKPTDDELRDRWLAEHGDTCYGLGEWRRYAEGIWPVVPELTIRDEIARVCEGAKEEGIKPTGRLVHSVYELAKWRVAVPDERWDANPDVLVCRNGVLALPEMVLGAHRADEYATSRVPYAYSAGALAPTWAWFLRATNPEAAEFLQEFAGYCLTTDTRHEIAVWLHGPPGSGKSTFLAGLQAMLGRRATVLGLADIEKSRFALARLPGKTLAVATEQPALFVESGHVLNAMISGEPIVVDRKYKEAFELVPRAKLCWAMNDLPRVSNANSGLFRRVKVVTFPPIAREKRDPEVKGAIEREGAGILNWAAVGLRRLRERGGFVIPRSVEDATAHFAATNDVPALFVAECCACRPDLRTQADILYQRYRAWCDDNGHKPMSSTKVAEDWTRLGFERRKIHGRMFWFGVSILGAAPPTE